METYLSGFCLRSLLGMKKKKKKLGTKKCHTKEKSYGSRCGFNLRGLRSGGRGFSDRGLRGLDLLDGNSGGGSSFGGRHY